MKKITVSILTLLLFSCDDPFVRDPLDPRLPKYTEQGYGDAGAIIDGEVWLSRTGGGGLIGNGVRYSSGPNFRTPPGTDSLIVRFEGVYNDLNYLYIEFILMDTGIEENLIDLNGRRFELDGVVNSGQIFDYGEINKKAGVGQIHFRSVKPEPDGTGLIFSGTFGFTTTENGGLESSEVAYGRFDY